MTAKIRIMVRVTKRRIEAGEDIETILSSWPSLSDSEKEQIRAAVA